MCPTIDVRQTTETTRGESFIDIFMTTVGLVPTGHSRSVVKTLGYESDHRAIELTLTTDEMEPAKLCVEKNW